MLYAAKSHIGLVRTMNQDGYIIVPDLLRGGLYLVADGMGGPSAGDVASQLAVERVSAYMKDHISATSDPADVLLAAVHHANEAIYQEAIENPSYQGMGTTVVCAYADAEQVHIAHVGDSRAYLLSGGQLRQVTKDHSLVAELVRRGQLTEDEARIHPQRNIVTRSLGTEPTSVPDVNTFPWQSSDTILLCSDGLTNLVSDPEITQFMRRAQECKDESSLGRVVDEIIELVLQRGGSDNVTALFVVHREGRGQA
ncbi:Stp1/IreP family PP2C-type Ser/Thr phosphatase [Alicyclobacillus fastidiosus]|uniref:Stp1/IreP family PP2C-type Ser/Thr phosphatase n=1 Tax=Alicyclobacillus fastidiosus TaxID=392011 RepID=A0ABY6ZCY1_9BACL|nr:Stp1/IreP family PP2C-type Ser/Thr phosphatase [Alicyclobacillus fastidiosus]WAH40398.1 Stp1/IreP family PP2C-type Ser/Thr phosphatase [Alicyclobacillus fastidiosus]GMA61790.1 protein-serine/threonine phosphatase [Alicyclobacillus fastidiosus]